MNKWISVEDKAPPVLEKILIYNGQIQIGTYSPSVFALFAPCFMTEQFGKNAIVYKVTHWHPLPELPKKEKEISIMNFQEAYKHYKQGKTIRRKGWQEFTLSWENIGNIIDLNDALSNDWYVVEEKEDKLLWCPVCGR